MTEAECKSIEGILRELETLAPDAPLIALGQTIFWDEPMKAGVAMKLRRIGSKRKFLAGVHDTDYFAKLPSGRGGAGKFKTFPHNDTTTRGLWSAAGEFSALFGSETVITRDMLAEAGLRVERVTEERPGFLEEATEAWGWRGVVALDDRPPVTAELPLKGLFSELQSAFSWAAGVSLDCLGGEGRLMAEQAVERIRDAMCDVAEDQGQTLSTFYQRLLPTLYEFTANAPVSLETTATSQLLRFNTQTCDLPRFELLGLYVDAETRREAKSCYDEAIRGSAGLYELSRFGTGAIPFDLVIPGLGRGTVRLGARGAVIMTPKPQFLSYKQPLRTVRQLAELIEAKFGPDCVLVGKAVTLIGLLAREFVFVFHEGASSYVKHSRRLHDLLEQRLNRRLAVNPILRVRYDAWDSLRVCCSWLRLPEPLQRAFGTEELCAPSFSERWRDVGVEQEALLARLGKLRRPIELIRYLDSTLGGSWHRLAEEYEHLHERLAVMEAQLKQVRKERDAIYEEIRALGRARVEAERLKGEHFRAKIFDKSPTAEDLAERERLSQKLEETIHRTGEAYAKMRHLRKSQFEFTDDPEVRQANDRRRAIELEAELKRARLIRGAVISSRGLSKAAVRPSAWWFPLVCPDGLWFRETIEQAQCYLEPLIG